MLFKQSDVIGYICDSHIYKITQKHDVVKMFLSSKNIQVHFHFDSRFDFSFEQYGQERLSARLTARQVLMCLQIYSYLWSNVLRMNKWHLYLHSCLISIATSRAFPAELRKNPEWYVKILNIMPIDCSCEFFMKLLNIVILL